MSVTDAPQITAAPQETSTPIFPREARCGLLLLAPKPHTIAETINARTLRILLLVRARIAEAVARRGGRRDSDAGESVNHAGAEPLLHR